MTVKLRMGPMRIGEGPDAAAMRRVLRDLQLSQEARTFMEHVTMAVKAATTRNYEVTLLLHCEPGEPKK